VNSDSFGPSHVGLFLTHNNSICLFFEHMTFVLNILHKDYSLLAADRRGKSEGPVTMTTGGFSITTSGNTVIDGVQKIYLSKNAEQAVGIAGTVGDHGYLGAFSDVSDGQTALECVSDFVHLTFDFDARDRMLNNEAVMENQSIVTFFDPDKGAFFSSLYLFTPFTHAVQLYARRANASPILLHVGSGSSNFEKAVGLEEINSFVKRLSEGLDLEQRLAWFDEAFAKVSALDSGCSASYEAVIATRDAPQFTSLRSSKQISIAPTALNT
jgi:hypothetical protein